MNKSPQSKRRANMKQALACLARIHEGFSTNVMPLEKEEWFTLVACATYIGKINAQHHKNKKAYTITTEENQNAMGAD